MWFGSAPDFFRRSHRIEHALYDLFRTCTMRRVRRFRLEQLGVREHDAELIVQAMEQHTELWIRQGSVHSSVLHVASREVHAVWPVLAT
jgi:hypothetical protein